MKLDNRGWGLREMLIYSSLLLVFLLIATVRLSALYDDVGKSKEDSKINVSNSNENNNIDSSNSDDSSDDLKDKYDLQYYYDYEDKMVEATQKYLKINDYNIDNDTVKLDLLTLIDFELIYRLYDKGSNVRCEGYVLIIYENSRYAIKPYLSCLDYVTKDY